MANERAMFDYPSSPEPSNAPSRKRAVITGGKPARPTSSIVGLAGRIKPSSIVPMGFPSRTKTKKSKRRRRRSSTSSATDDEQPFVPQITQNSLRPRQHQSAFLESTDKPKSQVAQEIEATQSSKNQPGKTSASSPVIILSDSSVTSSDDLETGTTPPTSTTRQSRGATSSLPILSRQPSNSTPPTFLPLLISGTYDITCRDLRSRFPCSGLILHINLSSYYVQSLSPSTPSASLIPFSPQPRSIIWASLEYGGLCHSTVWRIFYHPSRLIWDHSLEFESRAMHEGNVTNHHDLSEKRRSQIRFTEEGMIAGCYRMPGACQFRGKRREKVEERTRTVVERGAMMMERNWELMDLESPPEVLEW